MPLPSLYEEDEVVFIYLHGYTDFCLPMVFQSLYTHSMSCAQSIQTAGKTEIDSLYCLKALCAFFVLVIHSSMYGRDEIFFLLKIAVPCFYVISGYFLYGGDARKEISRAWRWTKKVLVTYLFLVLVYLAISLFVQGTVDSAKMLLCGVAFGFSPSVHLWYLSALWQALVVFCCVRRMRCWSPLIVVAALVASAYLNGSYRYSCLWALALIGGGYFAAQYRISRIPALILSLIFLACMVVVYFCYQDTMFEMALLAKSGYFFASLCLLALCVRFPHFSVPWLSSIGKYHSGNIYYYHMALKDWIADACLLCFGLSIQSFAPPITYVVTLLFSILLMKFLHWLKRYCHTSGGSAAS